MSRTGVSSTLPRAFPPFHMRSKVRKRHGFHRSRTPIVFLRGCYLSPLHHFHPLSILPTLPILPMSWLDTNPHRDGSPKPNFSQSKFQSELWLRRHIARIAILSSVPCFQSLVRILRSVEQILPDDQCENGVNTRNLSRLF